MSHSVAVLKYQSGGPRNILGDSFLNSPGNYKLLREVSRIQVSRTVHLEQFFFGVSLWIFELKVI